jgi:hypothetical protein
MILSRFFLVILLASLRFNKGVDAAAATLREDPSAAAAAGSKKMSSASGPPGLRGLRTATRDLAVDECGSLFRNPDNNHLYGVVSLRGTGLPLANFKQAQDFVRNKTTCCGGKTAHLPSITSEAESDRFHEMLHRAGLPVGSYALIGLNNIAKASEFVWDSTNETASYTNWCGAPLCPISKPSYYPNRCVTVESFYGVWFDVPCTRPWGRGFDTVAWEYDCN